MATRLTSIDRELMRAQKGATPTVGTTQAPTTGYVDYAKFTGDDDSAATEEVLDLGGAPSVGVIGTWVVGATTAIMYLRAWVSHTGAANSWAPAWIATSQTGADGVAIYYPYEGKFNKADFGNAATCYFAAEVRTNGFRFLKFAMKGDATTGTLALSVAGGTT